MNEARDRAKLVDLASFDAGSSGLRTTISRSELEEALRSPRSPVELVLDVTRSAGRDDVEAHTLSVTWEPRDLEQLLRTTNDENITLAFDGGEIGEALGSDVEAHGLGRRALVLTVAALSAAGGASGASAAFSADGGGDTTAPAQVEVAGGGGGGSSSNAAEIAVAGGAALLITGAGFKLTKQRREQGRPA